MNISEPGNLSELPDGRPANAPDPSVLARMASEFFTALPGLTRDQDPRAALGAPILAPAPVPVPSVPAEPDLRAQPSTPGALASLPTIPGALYSGMPPLSFLQEARGLGAPALSMPAAPAAPAMDPIKMPSTTDVQAPAAPLARPEMPGQEFGFFEDLRPLASVAEPSWSQAPSASGVPMADAGVGLFDVEAVRRDFPILQEKVNGRPLVWLDNAATTQKPLAVIERLEHFYKHENSNIHRAAHELAARATDAYEASREKVKRFLNASSAKDIVFVRGATEAINLVAQSWGERNIGKDDEIVITWLEHHANIVPWQMLCAKKGAKLRVAPVDDHGQVLLDEYEKLLGPRTKLVSMTQVSNALGTVNPVAEMVDMAQRHGAKTMIDGAQAVSHMRVDVQEYDCDFYVFSGHKLYAPTGIGVLYGKPEVLAHMPPWQGGGNMISDVTFEKTLYQAAPLRFEAGTGNIADAVGLGAALDYLDKIGMANVARHEHELLVYATEQMQRIPGLRMIGTAKEKAGVLSFVLDGFRNEDVGAALNKEGIAVRSGHHCAQPILRRFGLESSVRPSLAVYNTCEDIDALIAAIWNIKNGRAAGPL